MGAAPLSNRPVIGSFDVTHLYIFMDSLFFPHLFRLLSFFFTYSANEFPAVNFDAVDVCRRQPPPPPLPQFVRSQ